MVVYNPETGTGWQAENLPKFDNKNYLTTVGFCIYAFEGIGVVMPIMQSCEKPDKFIYVLYAAILSLTLVYIFFGTFCCLSYGLYL